MRTSRPPTTRCRPPSCQRLARSTPNARKRSVVNAKSNGPGTARNAMPGPYWPLVRRPQPGLERADQRLQIGVERLELRMCGHLLLHLRVDRLKPLQGPVREVGAALRCAGRARPAALLEALRDLGDAGLSPVSPVAAAGEGGRDGGEGDEGESNCDESLHALNDPPAT